MNKLDREDRAHILHLLCEGSSIRAVTRLTGVSKNTVIKLMIDAGKACAAYHDEHVRNLKSKRVQVDEIWSSIHGRCNTIVCNAGRYGLSHSKRGLTNPTFSAFASRSANTQPVGRLDVPTAVHSGGCTAHRRHQKHQEPPEATVGRPASQS